MRRAFKIHARVAAVWFTLDVEAPNRLQVLRISCGSLPDRELHPFSALYLTDNCNVHTYDRI